MPTLRDRVQESLAARDPTAAEARADLDVVLGRARASRARRRWAFVAIPALAGVVVAVIALARRPPDTPSIRDDTAGHRATSGDDIHLYLHVAGQPEERALALDLTVKGTKR